MNRTAKSGPRSQNFKKSRTHFTNKRRPYFNQKQFQRLVRPYAPESYNVRKDEVKSCFPNSDNNNCVPSSLVHLNNRTCLTSTPSETDLCLRTQVSDVRIYEDSALDSQNFDNSDQNLNSEVTKNLYNRWPRFMSMVLGNGSKPKTPNPKFIGSEVVGPVTQTSRQKSHCLADSNKAMPKSNHEINRYVYSEIHNPKSNHGLISQKEAVPNLSNPNEMNRFLTHPVISAPKYINHYATNANKSLQETSNQNRSNRGVTQIPKNASYLVINRNLAINNELHPVPIDQGKTNSLTLQRTSLGWNSVQQDSENLPNDYHSSMGRASYSEQHILSVDFREETFSRSEEYEVEPRREDGITQQAELDDPLRKKDVELYQGSRSKEQSMCLLADRRSDARKRFYSSTYFYPQDEESDVQARNFETEETYEVDRENLHSDYFREENSRYAIKNSRSVDPNIQSFDVGHQMENNFSEDEKNSGVNRKVPYYENPESNNPVESFSEPSILENQRKNDSLIEDCFDVDYRTMCPKSGIKDASNRYEEEGCSFWIDQSPMSGETEESLEKGARTETEGKCAYSCTDSEFSPPPKRPKMDMVPKWSADSPIYSITSRHIQMAIVKPSYPQGQLCDNEENAILADILKRIDAISSDELLPKFNWCGLKIGALVFYCSNQQAADWLKGQYDYNKKVIPNCSLRVVKHSDLLRPVRVNFRTRNIYTKDPSLLFHRLRLYNPEFQCQDWKVVGKVEEERNITWTFEMPLKESQTLRWAGLKGFTGIDQGIFELLDNPFKMYPPPWVKQKLKT